MFAFVIKRGIYGVFVLFGVAMLIFAMFKLLPDPARMTMGQRPDVASIEAIRKAQHLDEPVYKQILFYLNDISVFSIHDDTPENQEEYGYSKLFAAGGSAYVIKTPYLGRSMQNRKRVTEIIREAVPTTAILGFTAMGIATFIGIFFGIIAALNQFNFWDNAILSSTVLGISQPSYFSGVVLGLIFGYWLSDWTGLSNTGALFEMVGLSDELSFNPKNLILPAIALGIRPIAIIVQLTRSSMLDVMSQDYIRTARAKGLSKWKVIFKHGLRNALNPVVTTISGWFASVLAGSFFIEIIFDCKGLGFQTVMALNNFDLPVIMGTVLFVATVFVTVNILVDLTYGLLDPRVSYGK